MYKESCCVGFGQERSYLDEGRGNCLKYLRNNGIENRRGETKIWIRWVWGKLGHIWYVWVIYIYLYITAHKGVPVPLLFKVPTPWLSLPPPFLKYLFPLPSFLFHPLLRYFRQFPSLSCNPLLPYIEPTNQPTFHGLNKYQNSDLTSSTVAFYQKSILNLLNLFTNRLF